MWPLVLNKAVINEWSWFGISEGEVEEGGTVGVRSPAVENSKWLFPPTKAAINHIKRATKQVIKESG